MNEDEDGAVGRRRKRARAEDEGEGNGRVEQQFSCCLSVEEEKAIKHFTGMSQKCVDWVKGEMEKAVSISFTFFVLCFVDICMVGPRFLRTAHWMLRRSRVAVFDRWIRSTRKKRSSTALWRFRT